MARPIGDFFARTAQRAAAARAALRRRAPAPAEGDTIIDSVVESRDGQTVAVPRDEVRPADGPRRPAQRLTATALLALVAVGLVGGMAWWLPGYLNGRRADQFVVLVAPFSESGGAAGQTGRTVADQLSQILTERLAGATVERIDGVPANPDDALTLVQRAGADVLVWGEVQPGGALDEQSLTPRLAYAPSGLYAPEAWGGYADRFAMPRSFALASAPINGRVLLPPLLGALRDYAAGDADLAFDRLGVLASDYPALLPALPAVIRGNVLWARGAYAQAADEYRRALAAPADDAARLANNLGAILIDADDGGALSALEQSRQLLNNGDMAELRYNFALLALAQGRPGDAAPGLEAARNLLADAGQPPSGALLLKAAQAEREAGHHERAAELLRSAERQVSADAALVPLALREAVRTALRAGAQEERGLQALEAVAGGTGPLLWQLDSIPAPASDDVEPARAALEAAVRSSEDLGDVWKQFETSQAANGRDGASLIASGQERRAERDGARRRALLALAETEQGRADAARPVGLLGRIWSTVTRSGRPLDAAASELANQLAADPNNRQVLALYARALRFQGDYDGANRQYDALIAADPLRPEGYAGKGLVALAQGNRDAARALLAQAIGRDTANTFFPARTALAQLEFEVGNWPAAVAQLRWLVANRGAEHDTLALAEALRRTGPDGLTEARALLLPLVQRNPPSAEALVGLGRIYADAGQREDAIQAYRDAIAVNGRLAAAHFELGQQLELAGDLPGAQRSLERAVELDGANTEARLALARVYAAQGQADAAANAYRAAVRSGVSDPRLLRDLGDKLLERGKPADAADAYTRAIELRPDDRQLHAALARAYMAQGDLESAQGEFQRALDLSGGVDGQALVGLGDVARLRGDYDNAQRLYDQALALDGGLVAARLGLGQVATGQGNWSVALGQFQAAADQEPNDPMARFWIGEALLRQNRLDEALASYQRAIELRGGAAFPEALLGMAQAQRAKNDIAAAEASLAAALRDRPDYAEALLFSGKLKQEQGQTDEALRLYSAAINANSRLAEPYYQRALLAMQRNDTRAARDDLDRAVAIQPIYPDAHYWLGRAYYAEDNSAAALQAFQLAVEQAGNYPEALLYEGLVQLRIGDRAAAANSFRSVAQADPNGEWGTRAQQELSRLGP